MRLGAIYDFQQSEAALNLTQIAYLSPKKSSLWAGYLNGA